MSSVRLVFASTLLALCASACDGEAGLDAGLDAAVTPDARVPMDGASPADSSVTDAALDAASPVDSALPDGGPLSGTELAFVATFLGGISVYTIDASGALTLAPGSPVDNGAHYYAVAVDPTVRFAYAVDPDAGDVVGYHVEASGALTRFAGDALHVGGSPMTLAMHPSGRVLYVGVDTPAVVALAIAEDGTLSMPAGSSTSIDSAPAYLAIDPAAHFLYASHSAAAGVTGLAVDSAGALTELAGSPFLTTETIFGGGLAIDPSAALLMNVRFALHGMAIDETGALTLLDGSPFSSEVGSDPTATSVAFDPSGAFVYAVDMPRGRVAGFAVDVAGGTLTAVPGSPFTVSSPYSVAIDPSGRFLYVPGDGGSIAAFVRNPTTGALTPVAGSPFAVNGLQPEMVIARVPDAP